MTDRPVLIVGAGPTGLVLALWLTRLGISVRIIDKTAEPGTTSRALAVQARTLEFYHQVGLTDAVIAGGVKIANLNFWVKGARAARVPLQRLGEGLSPYPFALVFPQDAHERLLIERLAAVGVRVERQTELLRFEQHDGGVGDFWNFDERVWIGNGDVIGLHIGFAQKFLNCGAKVFGVSLPGGKHFAGLPQAAR